MRPKTTPVTRIFIIDTLERDLETTVANERALAGSNDQLILIDATADPEMAQRLDTLRMLHRIDTISLKAPTPKDQATLVGLRLAKHDDVVVTTHSEQDDGERSIFATKEKLSRRLAELECQDPSSEVDVVFVPHTSYHVWTAAIIKDRLEAKGLSTAVLDVTHHIKNEGVRARADDEGISAFSYETFIFQRLKPRLLVVFNDWEPVVRSILVAAQKASIPVAAIVEGLQDYQDADVSRERSAYLTADTVFIPGAFDRRYFKSDQKLIVAGVPRIQKLYVEPMTIAPDDGVALINSNFTYGVLEDVRDYWLTEAVRSCRIAGIKPVVSRHHADTGTEYADLQTDKPLYLAMETCKVVISRFSSVILEALAMNRQAIYFNPHGENVDKFDRSQGAYQTATTQRELIEALETAIARSAPDPVGRRNFLGSHTNIEEDSIKIISEVLAETAVFDGADYEVFFDELSRLDQATRALSHRDRLHDIKATYAKKPKPRTTADRRFL